MKVVTYQQPQPSSSVSRQTLSNLKFDHFLQTDEEKRELRMRFFFSMFCKSRSVLSPDNLLFTFKEHNATEGGHDQIKPALVVYLPIIDIHADTIEAMSEVAAMLYTEYIATTGAQHLLVAGDAKTYLRLKELKCLYGNELDWLIPFIGFITTRKR